MKEFGMKWMAMDESLMTNKTIKRNKTKPRSYQQCRTTRQNVKNNDRIEQRSLSNCYSHTTIFKSSYSSFTPPKNAQSWIRRGDSSRKPKGNSNSSQN